MDWSIVATFVTTGVGVVAATWAIVRERSPLRELERITAILKETPEDAPRRADLEGVRDHLSRRINFRYRAPAHRGLAFISWYMGISALLVLGIVAVVGLFGENPDTGHLLDLGVGALSLGFLSPVVAVTRYNERRKWVLKWSSEKDTHTTARRLI